METVTINNKQVEVKLPDAEEKYLAKLVFGDVEGFASNLRNVEHLNSDDEESDDEGLEFQSDSDRDEFLDSMGNQEYGFDSEKDDSDNESEIGQLDDDQLFFNDSEGEEVDDENKMDVDSDDSDDNDNDESDEDAWEDSDDERLNIDISSVDRTRKLRQQEEERFIAGNEYIGRLQKQYNSIFPAPEWAAHKYEEDIELNSDDENNEGNYTNLFDKIGSASHSIVTNSSNPLKEFLSQNRSYAPEEGGNGEISVERLIDANIKRVSHGPVHALSFHPTQPLLLVGGLDRTLRVFHIDGRQNEMITSLHMRQSPVNSASFVQNNNGKTFVLSGGRRKYMMKWSVEGGAVEKITRLYSGENRQKSFEKFVVSSNGELLAVVGSSGWVHLMDIETGRWIHAVKAEGIVSDLCFLNNNILIIGTSNGEIWEFTAGANGGGKLINKWTDGSIVGLTTIRVSNDGKYIAVGCNSGYVHIYNKSTKELIRAIGVLTTSISSIEFSPDNSILCVASRTTRDALRLIRVKSGKVVPNWPTARTPLGRVSTVAWAPSGGYLATANDVGRVRLWKVSRV